MSGRSGLGQIRAATLGPQPLKATVPYQLAGKHRLHRRDGKSAGKSKVQQLSSGMRRTMSLEAIIGPYLQGQWPKEPEGQSGLSFKDKSTQVTCDCFLPPQTPDSWSDESQSRRGGSSHKRSASWGSAENLREIAKLKQHLQQQQQQQRSRPPASGGHDKDCQHGYPPGSCSLGTTPTQPVPIPHAPLSTLVPRLRCSVEGLNQELEGMFVCQPPHPQLKLLEVPDGHRAPVPPLCSSGSQSDPASTPKSSSSCSSSSSSSPTIDIAASPSNPENSLPDLQQGLTDGTESCLPSPFAYQNEADLFLPLQMSSSPGPNKSCCFQREPPEGCEKVRVSEETSSLHQLEPALISSCPDPNKVNFAPHGISAFCPVSLLKPLLPSIDLLLSNLSVSPTGGSLSQGVSPRQATSPSGCAAPADPNDATAVMGENSEGLAF
ncbi:protein FAM117A-like [Brachionichthys hirsutus]|uniref:protein FAM117A-like n=1 Tax=Brachionichthys hirsutus TaxID=412623 RepID=UPI003604373B